MIRGIVTAGGLPIITLSIAGSDWTAIIDTGFNGDLELPECLRAFLNARYLGRVTSALAGGQKVEEEVFVVDFPFDGAVIQAETTFVTGTQVLIGTHLLRQYNLRIDFVAGTIELERR